MEFSVSLNYTNTLLRDLLTIHSYTEIDVDLWRVSSEERLPVYRFSLNDVLSRGDAVRTRETEKYTYRKGDLMRDKAKRS